MDTFWFWLMKPLAEIAFAAGVAAAAMLAYALWSLPDWLKQRRCPHDKVWEDGRCHAHCRACGKNLGFMGTWRAERAAKVSDSPTLSP